MRQEAGPPAAFVISWTQTEIDGLSGAPVSALERGASWAWSGEPTEIAEASQLAAARAGATDDEALRRELARGARRLIGRALVQEGARTPFAEVPVGEDRTFTVTDGRRGWVATLIDMSEIARPLLMFAGEMPPGGSALFISEVPDASWRPRALRQNSEGVVCFTPGTRLASPEGEVAVEDLVAGDLVWTKDDGAQEVLWVGHRHVSGARLLAMPDLRPIRIRQGAFGDERPDADLVVSPDHRVILEGPAALALWGEREVLVAARDLVDDRTVMREMHAPSVDYVHLLLPRHGIVWANGMETESFHPASTDLDAIAPDQLARLFDVMPDLRVTPSAYGPLSRRVLNEADAALIGQVT